ncbi:hypothetical protein FJ651_12265 [Paucihalobacter ruber]|uniref:Uncharacterized protein n=1 Tax=Paucihalobacter ruber TaxID=2567861 RepID=A0A506PG05_9FLAO|nr:hypothetical protein [Paucihalobacter ruber]TPV32335.1 hypothetical protein FJ651_12265 [Paucihalobacter ruber]
MKLYWLIVLLSIVFLGSAQTSLVKIPKEDLNFKYNNGTKVYFKKVDYFNYDSNNYLLDSMIVKNDTIQFKKEEIGQQLYLISDSKSVPLTFLPLRQDIQSYTYFYCGEFYKYDNYILINNSFSKIEYDYLRKYYKRISRNDIGKYLYKGPSYKKMSVKEALSNLEKQKLKFLHNLEHRNEEFSAEFINYIETEINLHVINQFLNWYEFVYKVEINKEFSETSKSTIHEDLYSQFYNGQWNRNSIQYFRTVQRVLNYQESKRTGNFKIYNEEIHNKDEILRDIFFKTLAFKN